MPRDGYWGVDRDDSVDDVDKQLVSLYEKSGIRIFMSIRDFASGIATLITDTIPDTPDSANVLFKKVTIPSAQVLTLWSAPITAIAAPGVNKTIQVLDVEGKISSVLTPYATNIQLEMTTAFATIPLIRDTQLLPAGTNRHIKLTPINSGILGNQITTNQALVISVATGNPTAGDGDIDVYITYRINDI